MPAQAAPYSRHAPKLQGSAESGARA